MFGSTRLFCCGVPFCLIDGGKFYFRVPSSRITSMLEQGYEQFVTDKNGIRVHHNYFVVPEEILTNDIKLYQHSKMAIDEALIEKSMSNNRIKDLPNLRATTERLLYKIGIQTASELRAMGAIDAYLLLRESNQSVTVELLFSLSAALKGIHKNMLTTRDKSELLTRLNQASLPLTG